MDDTLTPTEPSRDDYLDWRDKYIQQIVSVCKKTGASESFIRVLKQPPTDRHSVLMTLYRHHKTGDGAKEPSRQNVKDAKTASGSFFTYLWKDELWTAWTRADINNKPLMRACLDKEEIIACSPKENPKMENW